MEFSIISGAGRQYLTTVEREGELEIGERERERVRESWRLEREREGELEIGERVRESWRFKRERERNKEREGGRE